MNFGKFDIVVLFSMVIAVVVLAFTVPATGITASDPEPIPEFDADMERFDFAGDFPHRVSTPSEGTLHWDISEPVEMRNEVGSTDLQLDPPVAIMIIGLPDETGIIASMQAEDVEEPDSVNMFDVGNQVYFEAVDGDGGEWGVSVELTVLENVGDEDNFYAEAEFEVIDRPVDEESDGWLSNIPVIGTIAGIGESIAGVVFWLGSVVRWFFLVIFEFILNALSMLVDSITFGIDLTTWTLSNYAEVLDASSSWATFFVSIPMILIMLIVLKMIFVGISLFPFT